MAPEWIGLVLVAAPLGYAAVLFNKLVRLNNLAREAWSGIDVQLRRRTDLVPNLVAAVKAYAAHERGLFEDLAARRSTSVAADTVPAQAAAERALQGSLGRLFALAEAYPDLKADQSFRKLQDQLAEIEDQLQMARRYYNGTVRDLNVAVQSVPDVIVARLAGFGPKPFFEIDEGDGAAPQVEFSR
jgi:LemA protein